MKRHTIATAAFLAIILTACSGGGGGGSSTNNPLPPGGGGAQSQSANFLPLQVGATWNYTGGLVYQIANTVSVNGTTTYPYQGGCNAWEYLYADSSNNVYSIGQNVSSPSGPSTIYTQPELLVKGTLTAGDSWTNNFGNGMGTEAVSVGSPVNITANGTTYNAWPITYNDSSGGIGEVWYAANVGPVQVTNFCTSPSSTSVLTSYTP